MTGKIIRLADAGHALAVWRNRIPVADAHPIYGAFGRSYYPEVFGSRRRDESFAVVADGEPSLLVVCSLGEGCLDWYELPMAFFPVAGASAPATQMAITLAFGHLDALIEEAGITQLIIRDDAASNETSILGRECDEYGYRRLRRQNAICDLGVSEEEMHRCLRRRYKSHVNWGKRSLRMEFFNKESADRRLFMQYRDFHRDVAGRTTRPEASWNAMFDWIAEGGGEIVFGYFDERLVAAVMTVDGATTAYYASGVFDRTLFSEKMPLGHWPIWLSVLRARERGLKVYDIGDVPQSGEATSKEVNIGFFKSGFASRIAQWSCWYIDERSAAGVHDEHLGD